jgi:hypothetical protein
MTFRLRVVLISLLVLALAVSATLSITAPNWIARSPALAMLVVLAVGGVFVFSTGKAPRSGPISDTRP